MKFIHLSDLHLGKRMHNYDIMEEQRDALEQVLLYAANNGVDQVLIAGDVYDTTQPPVEAVKLLDWFLTSLAEMKIEVLMIAGNHDSPDRLAFGRGLLEKSGIQIAGSWQGEDITIVRKDEFGTVVFHLVPFLRTRYIRTYDETIKDQNDAFGYVRKKMDLNPEFRHVLVAHQYFSGSFVDREQVIMGQEMVNTTWLDGFDYCALGHLHNPQKVKQDNNRYAGTLLKFSAGEAGRQKSFTVVTLNEKDKPDIEIVDIHPLRDVVKIQGTLAELTSPAFVKSIKPDQYIAAVLNDEKEIYGAMEQLRRFYPRILTLDWKREKVEVQALRSATLELEGMNLIDRFFALRTGHALNSSQRSLMEDLWKEVQDETD